MEKKYYHAIYSELTEIVGYDNMLKVYRLFRGQQITFPVRLYDSKLLCERIIAEYDGANIRELAKKYDYSEKTIRRMIREGEDRTK